MAVVQQQIQMEFMSMKLQTMRQLDETYDRYISTLQQQKRGIRLALEHVIDYQSFVALQSLIAVPQSNELDIPPRIKQEIHSPRGDQVHFVPLYFSFWLRSCEGAECVFGSLLRPSSESKITEKPLIGSNEQCLIIHSGMYGTNNR